MLLLFVISIIAVAVGGGVAILLLLLLFLNFHANVENDLFVVIAVAVVDNVVDEIVDKAKLENRLDSKPTHLLLLEGFIIIFVKVLYIYYYNTTGTVVREELCAVVVTRLRYSLLLLFSSCLYVCDVTGIAAFSSCLLVVVLSYSFTLCCRRCVEEGKLSSVWPPTSHAKSMVCCLFIIFIQYSTLVVKRANLY